MNLHHTEPKIKHEEDSSHYRLHATLLNPCMCSFPQSAHACGTPKIVRESFIGTLTQAKRAAQCLLLKHGPGWKVVAETDGQTAYCTYQELR